MISARSTARIVGALMLTVFLLYGVGNSIAIASSGPALAAGVTLMLLNSVAVVVVGVLMFPILKPAAPRTAAVYLFTRIFEGTFLAVGAISLLLGNASANLLAYTVAMAGLGIGSLFFCAALYRSNLVPRFLAVWGIVGYASLATGYVLELGGLAGAGLISTIPGGLFELFFAVWILVRGFAPVTAALKVQRA